MVTITNKKYSEKDTGDGIGTVKSGLSALIARVEALEV